MWLPVTVGRPPPLPWLQTLVSDGYIPVVASVASNGKGQGLNVNADTAAGEVSVHASNKRCIRGAWHADCCLASVAVNGTYFVHTG